MASGKKSFKKILIANRGEIAVRVIRTCREMGIKTVAVYSEADRLTPHVLLADEAYALPGNTSSETYLNIPLLIDVIKKSAAEAVHPGYGFLSENTGFAAAVEKAGAVFIGPSAEAIRIMGDKTTAREAVKDHGVPLIPGSKNVIESLDEAQKEAQKIAFPILVKAAGGGGGKGMHKVFRAEELPSVIEKARREAGSAFGDDRVYMEKYIDDPHHIEIQVLADNYSNIIHFNERECSIQRRFQKIIEESPSPLISEEQRLAMGKAAVRVAESCNYRGAGTVEFLSDEKGNFYFLEMNTRLQVEHPVTEMVTGIDLVKQQILVAAGNILEISQQDVHRHGHAIEARIYAEDSSEQFMPSTGTIQYLRIPDGFGVRFDGAVITGQEISPFYDPMLGKLITWGKDRNEALARMSRALSEFILMGVRNSIPFCKAVVDHSDFRNGNYNTHFLEDNLNALIKRTVNTVEMQAAAIMAVHKSEFETSRNPQKNLSEKNNSETSAWKMRKFPGKSN